MARAEIVQFTHSELLTTSSDLSAKIEDAFGLGSLGLCVVSGVPLRANLLPLASEFAHLPVDSQDSCEHAASLYCFGWSLGKERMNGKPDTSKGSYYNNPIRNTPDLSDDKLEEFKQAFPAYGYENIWPTSELPALEPAFMNLGKVVVDVGVLLAARLDTLVEIKAGTTPGFANALKHSPTHKARLLHYYPKTAADSSNDSWCGIHVDHSILTGLTRAQFMRNGSEVEYSGDAGLHVMHGESAVKISIPSGCIAFQLGECAELASQGLLKATGCEGGLERNTFAVFMQPACEFRVTDKMDFGAYTASVIAKHY